MQQPAALRNLTRKRPACAFSICFAPSSVNAQSSSVTFLVNYATGQISVEQSAASVSARSASAGTPGSTLSTRA
jgi:hypothetical protein